MWFNAISGLKIDLEKSKLIPIRGGINFMWFANVVGLISVLGCWLVKLPATKAPTRVSHWELVKIIFKVGDGKEDRF